MHFLHKLGEQAERLRLAQCTYLLGEIEANQQKADTFRQLQTPD